MAENNPLLEIDGLGSPKEESNPLLQIDGLGETAPDVKKKEQTKPVQEAPLPGLGGVSEEPTPSPSVGQGVLRDVDRTQTIGEEFIAGVSDLTRTDVREPQQDGGADVMSEFILPPQNAEYTINDKKVSRSEFKDFMYDRNNAQDVFNGVSSISVKNDPEMEKFASRQVQSRETNDVWDSLKSGVITLGSSVLGAQQMVGDFLEDLTGIQPTGFAKMEKTAREESIKKLQEKAKEAQESRFQAEGDFIDLVSNGDFSEAGNMAVNTVVESGPLSLTALAATAATGNPMAGFAVLAPITTGMTYSEQMTTEDEAIKNLSDTEKYLRATAFGLAEAGSEAISGKILGRSFKLFGKGVSDMVSRISSEFGEQVATDVARSSAKKTISEIMKNYGLSMAEEGAAEGLTQLTQNLTDAFLGIREMSLDQVLEGVGNAIALGAASGGIMSTPGAVGQTVSNVSKKVLDYKLSKKNGAEELTSDAKRMAEFNKIFADNLSNIESNIELRNEAVSATPNDMVSDTETVDLVEEKKRIEKEIEGKDPVLSEDLNNRINDINSELKNKVESKKKESEAVPAKQKGRLTKFSTPQGGIVGEVTYEDGTKKELTQEEYDALEKQEGLFDVETGTQPVAETVPTEAVAEEAAPVQEAVEEAVTLDDISKKYEDVTLDVFEKENVLSLDRIIVPEGKRGEGIGSSVMQDLIDYADKNNLKIILTPSKDFGATSVTRLNKFYKQFGFIDNKGKNRDFSHRESMYRNPEKVVSKTEEVVDELPKEAPTVTTKEITEGKKEITEVKSGTHTSTNPIKIFKGIGGKKDLKGIRINAHKGAEGVFTAVDKNLAEDYARGEGVSETVLPAGTTFEVVEIDGTGMTPGQYRDAEVKAINESKADVVKLITVDGKIKAGTKKQEQYVIKNEKLIEDAIQEQAAGKVPVQPEAKPGKKVEEGKPQAEPEVAAEKGKEEVSEEEKVKAAKENLNSVWEKWKQSQKNLGVAFDPKSKANEDMELLEAFLTYIKALGIKTAKDIQKAFNDFTGGEATLDEAGAEFIAEKVKPKKGETNYEKTEEMNRSIIEKASKSLFNKAKKLFMSARRTFVKYSSNTRELLKSTNDIMPVYDYFVSRLGSPGNANFIFQEAKKKIYDDLFPTLRKHLDSLIKYRRIITINESRVESNRKGLDSLGVSEMFEKAGSEAVAAFKEAVTAAIEYANVSEEQSLDAKSIKKAAIQSLKESDWYRSLSDSKKARFEKQLNEDLGFLKSENFTGKDSSGNPIGLSVARGIISDIEVVVGKKDFEKISKRADLYFDEFKKLLKKDLEKGIISQEQYDAMIGKDYSPRIFLQHMFGFDNEFVNNVDDRRLAREYSLSSDAIKTLKDGLKDLYVDDAYWELITDSEKLLAGYISSRERRYQFNDLNKKLYNTLEKLQQEYETLKSKKNKTDEELLRYKKLGNIFDAFSLKQKRGHSSVHYYKNGERVSFYMRNDIFEEWYDMRGSYSTDNKIIAFMDYMARLPQRTLQSFATGVASPLFFVKNVARDFVQMTVISDSYGNWTFVPLSFAKAMKDFFKASVHIFKEDELYKEAMDAGISMEFLYMAEGLDLSGKISEGLLKLAEKSKLTQSGAMALRKGVSALSKAGIAANRYGELGFRIAIYERIRNAEYKKIESNKDSMTNDEYLEALEDARKKAARASADFMNFREGGSFTKGINPYASYINAAVIGTDTIAMEFRKNPVAFTSRMLQGVVFLTSTMVSFGLLMLSMFDDDEDFDDDTEDKDKKGKDKKYGVLKKYYKIIDSVSPYYRNTYYIIPTGGKDENGNYNVIRIAKNQALIPLSYAMEKAIRHNLEKHFLGDDKMYDMEDLKKDAFEMNYLFHQYVMPINLSPIDEKGRAVPFTEITSSLVQKNIPLSLMMISMTGYDPYTNRYISPEKKFQTELDSKYLIGWNNPEIQGFYKKIAKELNSEITPAEMKVMVEKIVTRPENNPYVASVYALLDRRSKVSDIIKKDRSLVGDIANMVKKSVVIPADYVERSRDFSSSKIEDEIRKYKEEKYVISKISSTVMKDLKEKAKKGDIDLSDSSEENKMKIKEYVSEEVDKQVGVFGESGVNVTNKDKMEIEDKILRSITPMLKLPIQPTQYRVPLVVDRDANVMAYRFLDEFGSLTVIGKNNDEFEAIMKQMFSEYTRQYGSEMSNKKFDDFVRKYEEIKNDEELLD